MCSCCSCTADHATMWTTTPMPCWDNRAASLICVRYLSYVCLSLFREWRKDTGENLLSRKTKGPTDIYISLMPAFTSTFLRVTSISAAVKKQGGGGFCIFSQPTRLCICAMLVSILVKQSACKLANPQSGQEPCSSRTGFELHVEPLSQLFTLATMLRAASGFITLCYDFSFLT